MESHPLEKESILTHFSFSDNDRVLQGRFPRREAEPAAASQRGAAGPRGVKRNVVRTETPVQRYSTPSFSLVLFLQGILMFVLSLERKDLTGLHPERLPITPPPARLQRLARKRRRVQGAHRSFLRQRMRTGCLPQILKWRVP